MATTSITRIDALNRDNYDTWKMHMEALLVKNDEWEYVSGTKPKPEIVPNDAASRQTHDAWTKNDNKARSDIILSISSSELKQIKGCITSRDVWLRLETIYQSKGPARKATLLKQLILQRMQKDDDVREHLHKFFDAVDKLTEMEVDINEDLLTILLLYSLPSAFENFRCAIESRDDLPTPETLRIKIIEECEARKHDTQGGITNAMIVNKKSERPWSSKKKDKGSSKGNAGSATIKCYRCRKMGHKASECPNKTDEKHEHNARKADQHLFYGKVADKNDIDESCLEAFRVERAKRDMTWCLDSGCTSHLSMDKNCVSSSRTQNVTFS